MSLPTPYQADFASSFPRPMIRAIRVSIMMRPCMPICASRIHSTRACSPAGMPMRRNLFAASPRTAFRHRICFRSPGEDAPTEAMVSAARAMLSMANTHQLEALRLPLDSTAWRKWSNPEIYTNRHGIRLDEVAPSLRLAILRIVEASLSPDGYRKGPRLHVCEWVSGAAGVGRRKFSTNSVITSASSASPPSRSHGVGS